jgi:hypothetical protein
MRTLEQISSIYVFALGIALIVFGATECVIPKKIFAMWKWWICHKLFPLHGISLMIGGLPLTFFREGISGKIMMGIGAFVIFSGPFILLFPKRMQELFTSTEDEFDESDVNSLVYFDAFTRIVSGSIFLYVILHYFAIFQ